MVRSVLLCILLWVAYVMTVVSSLTQAVAAQAAATTELVSDSASLFIVQLTTGPNWDAKKAPHEQTGFKEHGENLNRMRREGMILVGARFKDKEADKGMMIMRGTSREEVIAQLERDLMIRDKRFIADIAEFRPFMDGYVPRSTPRLAKDDPFAHMSWLAGCWSGRNGKFEFHEHWTRAAGGVMLGMGRTLQDGKLSSHEAMRIELDVDGKLAFIAKPSGQEEGRFSVSQSDETGTMFENPKHDFPQRVSYRRKPDGSLHARIEGAKNGQLRGIDFTLQRAGCD